MIGLFAGIPDWMLDGFGTLFIQLLDRIMYIGLANGYALFKAVAGLNVFGTEGGSKIFNEISHRVYNVIFIVAIFMISYSILTYIINPEKNHDKMVQGTGVTFKNILFSIVLVIMCPLIFKYMAIFQEHVLTENTIGAIIAGTGTSKATKWTGKGLAASVYMSVFHPMGTDYTTFYEIDDGETKLKDEDEAVDQCTDECDEAIDDESLCEKTCEEYYAALEDTEDSMDEARSVVGTLATQSLIYKIADGSMEYLWILATIMGWLVAWFFISYALDLGVRAVKLGILQLIAPVPILMKPFQKPGGMYEKWSKELVKCYVEVFARLVIVFFVVEMFKLIPSMLSALFDADNDLTWASKPFAFLILILGLLKFAKEAPDLFKQIFSSGGNWLSGLNLKPGVRKRIEDNDYAMKGLSSAAGALSGAAAGMMKAMKDHRENNGTTAGVKNTLGMIGSGIVGAARGTVHGGATGWKNSTKDLSQMGDIAERGRSSAHVAQQKAEDKTMARYKEAGLTTTDSRGNTIIDNTQATLARRAKARFDGSVGDFLQRTADAAERVGAGASNTFKNYIGANGVVDYSKVNALENASNSVGNVKTMQENRVGTFNEKAAAARNTLFNNTRSNRGRVDLDGSGKFREFKLADPGNSGTKQWYALDSNGHYLTNANGDYKTIDDLIKEERIKKMAKDGFDSKNTELIKESISKMEKALKSANLSDADWQKIADKMNKAGMYKQNGETEITVNDLKSKFSETLINKSTMDSSTVNNESIAKIALALKEAGGAVDNINKEEKNKIRNQQAAQNANNSNNSNH